jgi:hypothetical protein
MQGAIRFGAIVALCAVASTARAARDSYPEDEERTSADDLLLGHHFFQLPALQPLSFMTTHVGLRQGVSTLDVPDAPVTTSHTTDIHALAVSDTLEIGIQFLKRFQALVGANATAFSGTGVKNIIVGGAAYSYRGSLGLGFNIWRGPTTNLSVRAIGEGGSARKFLVLNLLDFVASEPTRETIDQIIGGNTGKLITDEATRWSGSLSFHVSQSLGKAFALQGTLGLTFADINTRFFNATLAQFSEVGLTLWVPNFAVAADFDFRSVVPGFPLDVMAEYGLQLPHASNRTSGNSAWLSSTNTIAFGAYYSGRRNLLLGVNFARVLQLQTTQGIDADGRPYPTGRPTYDTLLLSLRYTW